MRDVSVAAPRRLRPLRARAGARARRRRCRSSSGCRRAPTCARCTSGPPGTASRASPRPPSTARDGGDVWWRADVEVRNPVSNYRFLLDRRRPGYRWLNAAGLVDHDVPDHGDFKLVSHAPPPAWARRRGDLPDLPGPVRPLGRRRRPDRAGLGDPVRLGHPGHRARPGDAAPVLRRRPGRHHRAAGPPGPARRQHRLPDPGLPGPLQPPLRRGRLRPRRPAARRGRGAGPARRRGARPGLAAARRHHQQPHRRRATSGSPPPLPTRTPPSGSCTTSTRRPATTSPGTGCRSLPKLNWGSAELRRRFATAEDSLLRRWLRPPYGLDGWRVDVANMTGRRGADAYTHEVARLLREVVARDPRRRAAARRARPRPHR